MKPKARTVLLAAALATGLLAAAPAQGRACEFLRRLFCWCHRPEPVVVEPIVEPRFYRGDCSTQAFYPSYGCATEVELGTAPPPAPPAEDGSLDSQPEKTFADEPEQSSEKPAEPKNDATAPPDGEARENGPNGSQALWQPMSRAAARALLSRPTTNGLARAHRPPVRPSHPAWVPVDTPPAKLAAR